jgi:hypothetical protein
MKKLLIVLAVAVCVDWAGGTFSNTPIRKCEDDKTICYQTGGPWGVALSCKEKP